MHTKGILDPIRKAAERARLRPLDTSPEWIVAQSLTPAQATEVTNALREVFFSAAMVRRPAPLQDPVKVAWESLRTAIRAHGISTIGLAQVSGPAIADGKMPANLTFDWAAATATKMDQRQKVRF